MINTVELDLINKCNLKCPLCLRQEDKFKSLKSNIQKIDLDSIKKFLKKYKNITTVKLIGTTSEPTLYPEFLELCEFIESLNIKLIISTNGTKIDDTFWKQLSSILSNRSEILFAIDGSTQEIYEKYRVGGKLNNVLNNVSLFSNSDAKIGLQFIQFEHNKKDLINIENLAKDYNFNFIDIIECNDTDDYIISKYNIGPRSEIKNGFYNIRKRMQSKITSGKIDCLSLKESSIFIGYNSLVYPCSNLFEKDIFEKKSLTINSDNAMINVEQLINNRYNNTECFHACSKIGHKLEESFLKKRIIIN